MPSTPSADLAASQVAFAIGEPARACMLYSLLDGRARTSTELSLLAKISPSTASIHLKKLRQASLLQLHVQGKHHYYSLKGHEIASMLESLNVIATAGDVFVPRTPMPLRLARRCYDHLAGRIAVDLCAALITHRWMEACTDDDGFKVTPQGEDAFLKLGLDISEAQRSRRRFAYACLDWSERRPHLAGALASAFMEVTLQRRWFVPEGETRGLRVTTNGKYELHHRFGLTISGALPGVD